MVKRRLAESYRASSGSGSGAGASACAGQLLDSDFKKVAKKLTEKLYDIMWDTESKSGGVRHAPANPSAGFGGDGLFLDSRDAPWAETFIAKYMAQRNAQKVKA